MDHNSNTFRWENYKGHSCTESEHYRVTLNIIQSSNAWNDFFLVRDALKGLQKIIGQWEQTKSDYRVRHMFSPVFKYLRLEKRRKHMAHPVKRPQAYALGFVLLGYIL